MFLLRVLIVGYIFEYIFAYNGFFKVFEPIGNDNFEKFRKVVKLTDGNYIGCGHSGSETYYEGTTDSKGLVVMFDPNFDIIWSKFFGNESMYFYSCASAPDGGVVVSGNIMHKNGDSQYKGYAARLSSSGNLMWETSVGCKTNGIGGFYEVVALSDGDYAFLGIDGGCFASGQNSPYVLKIDGSTGTTTWGTAIDIDGGYYDSKRTRGLVERNGDLIICGIIDLDSYSGHNLYMMSLDGSNGEVIEAYRWNMTGQIDSTYGQKVIATSDGGFATAFFMQGSDGENYNGLFKVDSAFELEFYTGFRFSTEWDVAKSVVETHDGKFIVGGMVDYIVKQVYGYSTPSIGLVDSDGTFLAGYLDATAGDDAYDKVDGITHMSGNIYVFYGGSFNHTVNRTGDDPMDSFIGTLEYTGEKELLICGKTWENFTDEAVTIDDTDRYVRFEFIEFTHISDYKEDTSPQSEIVDVDIVVHTLDTCVFTLNSTLNRTLNSTHYPEDPIIPPILDSAGMIVVNVFVILGIVCTLF